MRNFLLLTMVFYFLALPLAQGDILRVILVGLPEGSQAECDNSQATLRWDRRTAIANLEILCPAQPEWKQLTIKVTPAQSGTTTLRLRCHDVTNTSWLLLDNLEARGITLHNGDFELLDQKALFQDWKCSSVNIVDTPGLAQSGTRAARISYHRSIYQKLTLQQGQPFELTLSCRLEVPVTRPAAATKSVFTIPEGSNVVYDPNAPSSHPLIVSTGRLDLRPTYENCSIYINGTAAEKENPPEVRLSWRRAGDTDWKAAMRPVYVGLENAWRGSLFQLSEDCEYELRVEFWQNGTLQTVLEERFRTRNSKVNISRTVVLPPGEVTQEIQSGSDDAYLRYTSNGAVLKGVPGKSRAVFFLQDISNVIFENMVVDASGFQDGFHVDNCRNIIFRNCEIYGFGRQGIRRYEKGVSHIGGLFKDSSSNRAFYDEQAFRLIRTRNILIERCLVHSPAFTANLWVFSHPSGAACIKVTDADNTVVRFNDFIGRDGARFIDHIQGPSNGAFRGGFTRDADVYGNFFAFSNDDAAEMEGGSLNMRFYSNRIEGTLSGISTGCCLMGPSYVIGNLLAHPGDEAGFWSAAHKNGGGADLRARGLVYILHDTMANSWRPRRGAIGSFSLPDPDTMPPIKGISRNNILVASESIFHLKSWDQFGTDCDGDLMHNSSPMAEEDYAEIRKRGLEPNGIFAAALYTNEDTGDFRLRPESPGYQAALPIPGWEGFPHCGAYTGRAGEWFPPRPLALEPSRIFVKWRRTEAAPQELVVKANCSTPFSIWQNDDFFAITPATGEFVSGQSLTFTVTLRPENMAAERRYNGAFLIRTPDGLSLPVTVYADRNGELANVLADQDNVHPGRRITAEIAPTLNVFDFNLPHSGIYYALIKYRSAQPTLGVKLAISVNDQPLEAKTKYNYDSWLILSSKDMGSAYFQGLVLPAGSNRITFDLAKTEIAVSKDSSKYPLPVFTPAQDFEFTQVLLLQDPTPVMRHLQGERHPLQ